MRYDARGTGPTRIGRWIRHRVAGAYLRIRRQSPPGQVANGILLTGIIAAEVASLFGVAFAAISPLLVLAIAAGVYVAGPRAGRPAVFAGTIYGTLRLLYAGASIFDPAVVGLTVSTGLLAPWLMTHIRVRGERQRKRELARFARFGEQARREVVALKQEKRIALDGVEALVWEAQPGSDRFRFLNSYAETMLGYELGADGEAEFDWTIVHSDDQRRLRNLLEAVAEDGHPRQVEYRITARDGYSVWVRDSVAFVGGVDATEERKLRGMAVDISARKQMEEDLHREKERFRSLFDGVPVGLYRMTPQGEFLVANSALVAMMGHQNHQAFYATNANELYVDPMDRWRWQNAMVHVEGVRSFELPCRRRDGALIWVRNTAKAVRSETGEIAYYEGVVEDITDGKRARAAEEAAESKFRGLVEQSLVGISMVQGEKLVYANPKMTEIFGYTHEELLDLAGALDLVASEHQNKVRKYFADRLETEDGAPLGFRGVRKDGSIVEVEVHCTRTTFNDEPAILGTLLDITDRKRAEEQLFHAAFHDPLTGLPNRILFMERLEHALQRGKRGRQFAVLFLDLNRFKTVNDSLGHNAGDELLRLVAQRLQTCLRPGDSISRFGGDEFALLLEDIDQLSDATQIAERIREAIAVPALLDGQEVYTGASIGIAISGCGYGRPEEVLRDADMAMYRAKGAGQSSYEVFDEEMHGEAVERMRLENDLQKAAEQGDFHLDYQPIVCLATGEFHGVEALVRWNHAERGAMAPSAFIPLAEEVGAIIPIGRQVLRLACKQLVDWQARFPREKPLSVNVNLSVRQIQGSPFVEDVRQVLEETGLPPECLKLEITESLIMEDRIAAAHTLKRLKSIGVRIFLDDFGTGYSSLGYLHTLPIDALKIDRTFTAQLNTEERGAHLVRTIVNVAHDLGMEVVAEGAETEAHVRKLRELGCEFAQGFHFCPPVKPEDIEVLLAGSAFKLPKGRKRARSGTRAARTA
jgi:diguanylate cyclase (GGDEF)-like protein/PAS domain S-box-containing protein